MEINKLVAFLWEKRYEEIRKENLSNAHMNLIYNEIWHLCMELKKLTFSIAQI